LGHKTSKEQATIISINKCNIKLKSFYTAKETIEKVKKQPREWEKTSVTMHLINT
jgi:hypothetical protein